MLYLGLLASFVLEYVRPGTYVPLVMVLKLNTIVPLLTFVGAVLTTVPKSVNADVLAHRNSRWFAFFLCLLGIAILHADVTFNAVETFKTVVGYLFLAFMVAKLIDSNDKFTLFVFVLALSHLALVVLNPNVVLQPETRSYIAGVTFLGDGNDFALSLVVLLPLCVYVLIDASNKFYKMVMLAVVGTLLLAVIGTSSRGASLGLAAVLLYMWWRGRRKGLGLLAIGAVVTAVMFYAPPEYFGRLETLRSYQEEGSAQGRIMAWKSAVRMANDHPITGVGTGHFPIKLGTEYRPPEYGDQNLPWLTAHSIYFLVLGELGYPGIFFLLGVLYVNYRAGERILRRVRMCDVPLARRYERLFLCLNGSLIGYAVAGAFLSALYYPHLYVISGIFIAAELMYRRDEATLFPAAGEAAGEYPQVGQPAWAKE